MEGLSVLDYANIFSSIAHPPSGFCRHYWVTSVSGDDGVEGTDLNRPLATIQAAYNRSIDWNHDVIHFFNPSGTAETIGSTGVWSRNGVHLVGHAAPAITSPHSAIASSAIFTPMLRITGNGCVFQNIRFGHAQDHATNAAVNVKLEGSGNVFVNCHFDGMGHATQAGNAAGRHLVIDGTAVPSQVGNYFYRCTFGNIVAHGNVANAAVEIAGASLGNVFEKCLFLVNAGAANLYFLIGSGGIAGFLILEDCKFMNVGTAMTQMLSVHASAGGPIMLKNCLSVGSAEWETTESNLVFGDNAYAAGTTGIGLALT